MLGASESISGFADLFEPIDKKHKIYSRKPAPTPAFHLPFNRTYAAPFPPNGSRPGRVRPATGPTAWTPGVDAGGGELSAQREADRIAVSQFAPPGVVINARNQVLQFRGPTGAYLEPPSGKASFDVLKMARDGLRMPLRAAISEATSEKKAARRENIRVEGSDGRGDGRTVHIE